MRKIGSKPEKKDEGRRAAGVKGPKGERELKRSKSQGRRKERRTTNRQRRGNTTAWGKARSKKPKV